MVSSYSTYNDNTPQSFTEYIDYKSLINTNPESLCRLSVNNDASSVITGIIDPMSTFDMTVDAKYQDMIETTGVLQEIQKYQGLASTLAGQSQVSIQSLRMSEQAFMGFNVGPMTVKMNVPIISKNDNPRDIAIGMLRYVVGARDTLTGTGDLTNGTGLRDLATGAAHELMLAAPNRYRIEWKSNSKSLLGGEDDVPHGTATVLIGTRFAFQNVLLTRVALSFSNKVYYDGKCTQLGIQFSFIPWRAPSMADVKQWIQK